MVLDGHRKCQPFARFLNASREKLEGSHSHGRTEAKLEAIGLLLFLPTALALSPKTPPVPTDSTLCSQPSSKTGRLKKSMGYANASYKEDPSAPLTADSNLVSRILTFVVISLL